MLFFLLFIFIYTALLICLLLEKLNVDHHDRFFHDRLWFSVAMRVYRRCLRTPLWIGRNVSTCGVWLRAEYTQTYHFSLSNSWKAPPCEWQSRLRRDRKEGCPVFFISDIDAVPLFTASGRHRAACRPSSPVIFLSLCCQHDAEVSLRINSSQES